MDASQGISGRVVSNASDLFPTQTPQAAAMTETVAAATAATTLAVASTALAASPAVPAPTGPYYFDANSGVNDIMTRLVLFLERHELMAFGLPSEVAATKLKEPFIIEWAKLGVTVLPEDIPPVPDLSLLNPGEFLVLIPKGLKLNDLESNFHYFKPEVKEAYGEQAVESSYWVAVPDKVLEETRDIPFADQVKIMKDKCPGAEVLPLLASIAGALIRKERTGKGILEDRYTRTLEKIGRYETVVVGCFSPYGLDIDSGDWGGSYIALLPIRKLQAMGDWSIGHCPKHG
jgi:hypothetical protein